MTVLPILHQDEHLVVVNKPSGLLVHRGWARDREVAMSILRDMLGHYVYPVHRLDRGASGAVLMGTREDMAGPLHRLFELGLVEKRYLALVRGPAPESGTIDHPLPRDPDGVRVPAVTHFRTLGHWERYSLVEAQPVHGRLHQIRRHFKHISHPLIGDVRYGKGEHNRMFRERFGLQRLALHAVALSFTHPVTGERLQVRAPLTEDLRGPLRAMDLWLEG